MDRIQIFEAATKQENFSLNGFASEIRIAIGNPWLLHRQLPFAPESLITVC